MSNPLTTAEKQTLVEMIATFREMDEAAAILSRACTSTIDGLGEIMHEGAPSADNIARLVEAVAVLGDIDFQKFGKDLAKASPKFFTLVERLTGQSP